VNGGKGTDAEGQNALPVAAGVERNVEAAPHRIIRSEMKMRKPIVNRTTMRRATNAAGAALLPCCVFAIVSVGCQGPSADPVVPSGGRQYVMDYTEFSTVVDPILTAHGCDNLSCHGGGIRGTFELSPANAKDVNLDFTQACLQVNPADPESSPLLAKPLSEAAGGSAHAGDSPSVSFPSTDDPDFQAILAWIQAGEYQ